MGEPAKDQYRVLAQSITDQFSVAVVQFDGVGQPVVHIPTDLVTPVCTYLKESESFEQLIDICGLDYLHYGVESGAESTPAVMPDSATRFQIVYHLLSVTKNSRIRIHANLDEQFPAVESVIGIWAAADWFEREAFDLFGIMFEGHPDLRRILTDYGFVGHPFRKDFPISGHVEMRYDPGKGRVIYQPVSIEPRVLVPKTITPPAEKSPAENRDGRDKA